ncbi:MAG: TVP38/TMEM64 family protein [Firmicutes bacterium]|nr:TVP38/TMEM64 family protein [Bacillota bacterium]
MKDLPDPQMQTEHEKKQAERKAALSAFLVCLAAVAVVLFILYREQVIRMMTDPKYARDLIRSVQPYGALVYVAVQAIQIIIVVIPGEPLELAAGYAFGAVTGSLLCLLGESIGSIIVLLLVRRYGHSIALHFFSQERLDKLKFLHYSPKKLLIFSIIFILPGSPKALLCYFAGLTDIDIHKLMIICTLGRIPAIVTSTIGGNAIGEKQYVLAAVLFLITAALSAASIALYNYICERHGKDVE